MLVKLQPRLRVGQAVEIVEERKLRAHLLAAPVPGAPLQVVDDRLGVDFFLDVQRRRRHHQIRPVLFILAPPHQLRVQVGIARIPYRLRRSIVSLDQRLKFRGRNILPRRLGVGQRLDPLAVSCHGSTCQKGVREKVFLTKTLRTQRSH